MDDFVSLIGILDSQCYRRNDEGKQRHAEERHHQVVPDDICGGIEEPSDDGHVIVLLSGALIVGADKFTEFVRGAFNWQLGLQILMIRMILNQDQEVILYSNTITKSTTHKFKIKSKLLTYNFLQYHFKDNSQSSNYKPNHLSTNCPARDDLQDWTFGEQFRG